MKKFLVILIFVSIGSSLPAMTQEPNIPEDFKLTPLMRSTHFVRDVDESLKLYRDILGLRPRIQETFNSDEWDRILGIGGKTVRVAILQSGDTVFANVGLFQFVGEDQPAPPDPRTFVETGDAALVFLTNDIFEINDRVKAAGYAIVSEPIVLFPEPGSETQSYESLFFDRDGILVNLIQRNVHVDAAPK